MRSSNSRWKRTGLVLVAASVTAILCFGTAPGSGGPATGARAATVTGGATFDFFSMFPEQYLSPAGGKTKTFMPLETRNIGEQSGEVKLTVAPESPFFTATITPDAVTPATGKPGRSRVYVECAEDTPDNTIGWVKVLGTRGSETHHIWLKATVVASRPRLDLSRGPVMGGQGYLDPALQAYTGKPVTWHVAVRNEGALDDTYKLSASSQFPFEVTFKNNRGKRIEEVKAPGKTRNLLYSGR
jgi:hypothetical protein